ncbi:MAG: ferredoxin [Euryarchaeota archaeon]|nr:ferredoxin [Euryarchaeota archaeon]
MARYRIEYDRKGCIGAGTCAVIHEEAYVMNGDSKADLVGSSQDAATGFFLREIGEPDLTLHKQAAEGCPALAIHIKNLDTGEEIL